MGVNAKAKRAPRFTADMNSKFKEIGERFRTQHRALCPLTADDVQALVCDHDTLVTLQKLYNDGVTSISKNTNYRFHVFPKGWTFKVRCSRELFYSRHFGHYETIKIHTSCISEEMQQWIEKSKLRRDFTNRAQTVVENFLNRIMQPQEIAVNWPALLVLLTQTNWPTPYERANKTLRPAERARHDWGTSWREGKEPMIEAIEWLIVQDQVAPYKGTNNAENAHGVICWIE